MIPMSKLTVHSERFVKPVHAENIRLVSGKLVHTHRAADKLEQHGALIVLVGLMHRSHRDQLEDETKSALKTSAPA